MTQTTNLENPENDTTTVTAVGSDAGEELAAMMANAGLDTGPAAAGYDAVDTGEPVVPAEPDAPVPVQMPMQDMIGVMDYPETTQEGFGDDDVFAEPGNEFEAEPEIEPSNADLDAIETDLDWDFDENIEEAGEDHRQGEQWSKDDLGNPIFTPMTRDQAMASDGPVTELEKLLTKFDDSEIQEWLGGNGNDNVDEALYAISMEDMPYGIQKARTGDPSQWLYDRYYEDIVAYAHDNFDEGLEEERDIAHANTPDELEMGVDMVTHGTSGGLNRPKTMYKPAGNRHGDNAMQRPIGDMYESEMDDEGGIPDSEIEAHGNEVGDWTDEDERKEQEANKASAKRGKPLTLEDNEEDKFVNEHENVDNFLNLYKAFSIRGEKK